MAQAVTAQLHPRGASKAEEAYERILQMLVTLQIQPGDPIHDEELMRELGIGRTPVREALKRLEVDKLVITFPKRGTFATRVEVSDLAYVSEIRQQLEPMAAARAARTASESTRAALLETSRQIERFDAANASTTDLLTFDAAVHRNIYRASGNPYLEDVLIRHSNLATRIWCTVIDRLPRVSTHVKEHLGLLQAIIDGDEAEAARLAGLHVGQFEQSVRTALLDL
ncbi:GntR family transcriptional regulator [Glutamicibacter creatinolyticus]|jgi:DNA-binding GntR family transcriptional regulator|uniref:GntR family transcriptional regulator n=1 Tax=Glutamicibacter TaxID=1742989 RepID=UPI0037BE7E64